MIRYFYHRNNATLYKLFINNALRLLECFAYNETLAFTNRFKMKSLLTKDTSVNYN